MKAFAAEVDGISRVDVLNSTLLAQWHANAAANRESQPREWYEAYREVLEHVGWVVQSWNFNKADVSGTSVTADKVIIDLIAAIASENQVAIAKATLDAAKALGDDDRMSIFEHSSHSANNGLFQLGSCRSDNGLVAMAMTVFHFSTTQNIVSILWFDFSTSGSELYQATQVMTLNQTIYAYVRKAVEDKLGADAQRYVIELSIAPA